MCCWEKPCKAGGRGKTVQVSAVGVRQLKYNLKGRGKNCSDSRVKAVSEWSAPEDLLTTVKVTVSRAARHRDLDFLLAKGSADKGCSALFSRIGIYVREPGFGIAKMKNTVAFLNLD